MLKVFLRKIALFLDRTTMYRVALYSLFGMALWALLLAFFGFLGPIGPRAILLSLGVALGGAALTHSILAKITRTPGNIESTVITGLIIFLIVTPAQTVDDALAIAGIAMVAIVGKFFIARKKKHIFNPVALALVLAGVTGYIGVEWWVSSRYMLPAVLLFGALLPWKTKRVHVSLTYALVGAATATVYFFSVDPWGTLLRQFISWPTIFIATVMITEPMGLPGTRARQYGYAAIAAIAGSIPFHLGPLYGTPELGILLANLYTLFLDDPARVGLAFVKRESVGGNAYEYRFRPALPLHFTPGQYMEWSIPHPSADTRGIRRFLTIASDPGDVTVSMAVRHVPNESSWKRTLGKLVPGDVIYAAHVMGDFTLRKDARRHVLIAGGIGITPFMSMIRAAQRTKTAIPGVLFYCNTTDNDIVFRHEVEEGAREVGLSVVHVFAGDPRSITPHENGRITKEVIEKYVPDRAHTLFYLSGPPQLVEAYEGLLRGMGVSHHHIITDYFPGLA